MVQQKVGVNDINSQIISVSAKAYQFIKIQQQVLFG